MPKKKRKYTFRKDKPLPYESGSIIHQIETIERQTFKKPKKRNKK